MKFSCNRTELQNACNVVQKAASNNSASPVLMGIMMVAENNKLKLTCNNLEIAIECEIPAAIETEGSVVVNSRLFNDIVRKVDGDLVHIAVNEKYVANITTGSSNYDILGFDVKEFPVLPVVEKTKSVSLSQKDLKELIRCTVFAAGTSENKLILTGSLFKVEGNKAIMVAIDGYRMALRQLELENAPGDFSFVIPAKSLNELNKIIEDTEGIINIDISDKNISFNFNGTVFISRLLEGEYIDYEKIIPKEFKTTVKVRAGEFENAVERASLIITNEFIKGPMESPLILEISQLGLEISSENNVGRSEEKIYPTIDGDELKIGFNHRYLLDAIKVCPCEEYTIGFGGSTSPCLIYPSDGNEEFKYLIVPVKLRS